MTTGPGRLLDLPRSALFERFGQLAWDLPVAGVVALHERFSWEHPMDGDYLTALRGRHPEARA